MARYEDAKDVLASVQSTLQFEFGDRPIRSIDDRGMFGDTPLIITMSWEDVEAARLLLEAGAAVDARGEDGETALHRAASSDSVELVRLLMDAGASADIENDEGRTPRDIARVLGNSEILDVIAGGRDRRATS
ncbi:MAG TPA: ankyrin repeat domain-containing protein [Caulobacteraceae bacterium]|nr:ankyrin repeat domain-containing protein [Caulobacteraceae bacterium]